jgi:hypothetical protein
MHFVIMLVKKTIESVVVMTIIWLIAKAWLGIFVVECNIEIILESDLDLDLLNQKNKHRLINNEYIDFPNRRSSVSIIEL